MRFLFVFGIILATTSSLASAANGGLLSSLIPPWIYRPPGYSSGSGVRDPSTCYFQGPTDPLTLRGRGSYLGNVGTGSCLTLRDSRKNGDNVPFDMDVCSWNSLPTSTQLFKLSNGNGGTLVKSSVSPLFGSETCMTTSSSFGSSTILRGERCSFSGKEFRETWRFSRVRDNVYQLSQLSSGQCLRVDSSRVGAIPTVGRCDSGDIFQLWRICNVK